jgi:hypothetical protein
MKKMLIKKRVRLPMIFLCSLSLGGCSGMGGGLSGSHNEITIDSDPQHASVYAEGTELGMTPLVIRPGEVFQARFTTGGATGGIAAFRYVGMLSIKKDGCKSYTTQVDDNILSRDIHVKLDCDPSYRAEKTPPATTEKAPVTPDAHVNKPDIAVEERLQRIESLYRKGLISEDEYRTLRKRILDTL